jgi:hypothetical protein
MTSSGNNECGLNIYCQVKNSVDTKITSAVKKTLKKIGPGPWILAVGFHRPHLTMSLKNLRSKNAQLQMRIPNIPDFFKKLSYRFNTDNLIFKTYFNGQLKSLASMIKVPNDYDRYKSTFQHIKSFIMQVPKKL